MLQTLLPISNDGRFLYYHEGVIIEGFEDWYCRGKGVYFCLLRIGKIIDYQVNP